MDSDKRFNRLVEEALAQSMTGWDFSFVKGRIEEAEPSWNYKDLVTHQISCANALLDMCTGGGEFLDQVHTLPRKTYATEGYPPNIVVAKDRLEPRGIHVVPVESDEHLPLADDEFDLIINRHGAYSAREVARISASSKAIFLTQQVGSSNASDLNKVLSAPLEASTWNLDLATVGLSEQGFEITKAREEHPVMSFKDIGAVVFYLKTIPWQIADFEYSKYRHKLLELHEQIGLHGSFDVSAHRFLIEARLG